jgi:heme-degrading monooxygenase HmoA
MWHGKVLTDKAEAYHDFLRISGLKDYGDTAGNKGVFLLKREEPGITHFYTLSFWEGWEAIKQFAGEDHEKARYYPEDKDFLLEFEPHVTHFDVMEKPAGL